MSKSISAVHLNCSICIANIFIIFFVVSAGASLNESEVAGRNRTTLSSLRLTRQKVFIQEIGNSEESVKKRKMRGEYKIAKGYEYPPSNIVVEELRIRAKINFQSGPRIRRDVSTSNAHYTNSSTDSTNPIRRTTMCHRAKFAINNNVRLEVDSLDEKPINIQKNLLPKTKKVVQEGTSQISLMKNIVPGMRNNNSPGILHSHQNSLRNFISNDTSSLSRKIFKNDQPRSLSVFYDYKEKLSKSLNKNDNINPRYRRSTKRKDDQSVEMNISHYDRKNKEFLPESHKSNDEKCKGLCSSNEIEIPMANVPSWNENSERYRKPLTKIEKGNATLVPFFEDYPITEMLDNKLNERRLSSIFHPLEKKMHRRSKERENVKSKLGELSDKPSRKRLNRDKFVLRLEKRAANLEVESDINLATRMKNQTIRLNDNEQNNTISNWTTGIKNGNLGSEISLENKQIKLSKSSTVKTPNTIDSKIKIEQRSNYTAWNLTAFPFVNKYFNNLVSSVFGPLFPVEPSNKNQSTRVWDENRRKNVSAMNTWPIIGENISEIAVNNLPYNSTERYFSNGKNSSIFFVANASDSFNTDSTKNNKTVSRQFLISNSTQNSSRLSMNDTSGTSVESGDKALEKQDERIAAKIFKQFNRNIDLEKTTETQNQPRNFNGEITMENIKPSVKYKNQNVEYRVNVENTNANCFDEVTKDLLKIVKSELYSGNRTLNFSIVDPNCNSSDNDSAHHLPINVEIILETSTYPTLRRHSRNDTVDEILKSKNRINHERNNDGKNREAKKSLNDSRTLNVGKKGRGRSRIRIEGKHPVGLISPSQDGKSSWRTNNGLSTSNFTRSPIFDDFSNVVRQSGKSTFVPIAEHFFNSSYSTVSSISVSLPSSTVLQQSNFSSFPNLWEKPPDIDRSMFFKSLNEGPKMNVTTFASSLDLSRNLSNSDERLKPNEISKFESRNELSKVSDDTPNLFKFIGKYDETVIENPAKIEIGTNETEKQLEDRIINVTEISDTSSKLNNSQGQEEFDINIVNNTMMNESTTLAYDQSRSNNTFVTPEVQLLGQKKMKFSEKSSLEKSNRILAQGPNDTFNSFLYDGDSINDGNGSSKEGSVQRLDLARFETAPDLPAEEEKKIVRKRKVDAVSLGRSTRDTGNIIDYKDRLKTPLASQNDKKGMNAAKDTKENNVGRTWRSKGSRFIVDLGHSAVHDISDENNEDYERSTMISSPLRDIRKNQYLRVSTVKSTNNHFDNRQEFSYFSDNLTDFIDDSNILAFVESLENFLFDDSVTGVSKRKQLTSKNQNFAAETMNAEKTETRSAIFKKKKISVRNIKNWKK